MTLATRIVPVTLQLVSPIVTGHGAIGHRRGLLLALTDGELTGWGEAAPLPGWSNDTLDVTDTALRSATSDVRDDRDVPTALASLRDRPHARAALSGAWADLRSRRDGLPLAPSLSPDWLTEVPVNALIDAASVDAVDGKARAVVAAGFTTVKMKVGAGDPATDVERVRAVRRAAPDVVLRLDANRAWDRETAVEVLRRVAEHDIAWCEEPTPLVDEFGSIESATGVPIAADESIVGQTDLRLALDLDVSVVVIKPQAIGGPDRAAVFTELVDGAGATVVVTSFMDSVVGVAHALHVAAAFGSPVAHGLATGSMLAEDVGPPLNVDAGRMRLPTAPGIGIDPTV